MFAGGLVYLSRLPVHGAYLSDILPGLAMIAVGAGLGFVSIINAATGAVPRSNAGVAAGLVNTTQRVGSAVGLAVLTAVTTARTRALAAPGHQVIAVVGGYDRAFAIAAWLRGGRQPAQPGHRADPAPHQPGQPRQPGPGCSRTGRRRGPNLNSEGNLT